MDASYGGRRRFRHPYFARAGARRIPDEPRRAAGQHVHAMWALPQPIPVTDYGAAAVAVNARGDAAVAFASSGSPALSTVHRTAIRVWVREHDGRMTVHEVFSSKGEGAGGLAVGLDTRGEATVVWVSRPRSGIPTVRAAFGTPRARWAPARAIGRGRGDARVAVAPAGDVLATWTLDGTTRTAWRRPRHSFGDQIVVKDTGPVPAFDGAGTAYLSGVCRATVARAAPGSRRFAPPVVLNPVSRGGSASRCPARAKGSRAGRGEAAFPTRTSSAPTASCGPPRCAMGASRGRPASPASPGPGRAPSRLRGGGGSLRWANFASVYVADVAADGTPGPARLVSEPLTAIARDGGGGIVLGGRDTIGVGSASGAGIGIQGSVTVVPAGVGPDDPAPSDAGLLAAAAPVGRAVALTWTVGAGPQLALSVWRPG